MMLSATITVRRESADVRTGEKAWTNKTAKKISNTQRRSERRGLVGPAMRRVPGGQLGRTSELLVNTRQNIKGRSGLAVSLASAIVKESRLDRPCGRSRPHRGQTGSPNHHRGLILSRIGSAFKSFFSILFKGVLPEDVAREFGFVRAGAVKATPLPAVPARQIKTEDGALQLLAILQRDGRLVDFLMEDISGATDEQIGAAVRSLQEQCRQALDRYVRLAPVIDGVEGSYTTLPSNDPAVVKLLGNVPPNGKVQGGTLRHRGWRAEKVELPALRAGQKTDVIAPAEIEVE